MTHAPNNSVTVPVEVPRNDQGVGSSVTGTALTITEDEDRAGRDDGSVTVVNF